MIGCDELEPVEALRRQHAGALLIDVRESDECAAGGAAGAINVPLRELVTRIATLAAPQREVIVICALGQRSLHAVHMLRAAGYPHSHSVRGGLARWRQQALPSSGGALDADATERYARQLQLPQIGVAGQLRLAAAHVVLVGAGGLGSAVAQYLVAAGVGRISLIDDDRVERSNLQRQVIHAEARIGMAKVESARVALAALNPSVRIDIHEERLCAANVERLLADRPVVVDGADNLATRYLLATACLRLRLPLVYGAVQGFTGQVSVFDARRADSPCYRCLYPVAPAAADAPNCSAAGVLGVVPGLIGLWQANEALKLVLGIGSPLVGRVLWLDALAGMCRELQLARDPRCRGCGAEARFGGYDEVARLCAGA